MPDHLRRLLLTWSLGLLVPVAFLAGACYGYAQKKEVVETIYLPVYVDGATTGYVSRSVLRAYDLTPGELVSGLEATQEETSPYRALKEFPSVERLQRWLDINGGMLLAPLPPESNDCDDRAKRLQARAVNDGYNMSLQLVGEDGYLNRQKVSDGGAPHMMNLVCIGNDCYAVEPVTKTVTRLCSLD
jgi:hypothetical protein